MTEDNDIMGIMSSSLKLATDKDVKRLDWLGDVNNKIGNVQLPTECVLANPHSLRDAIDAAMALDQKESG